MTHSDTIALVVSKNLPFYTLPKPTDKNVTLRLAKCTKTRTEIKIPKMPSIRFTSQALAAKRPVKSACKAFSGQSLASFALCRVTGQGAWSDLDLI
jgi:hypothetical protein